jgi:hypothetical protein
MLIVPPAPAMFVGLLSRNHSPKVAALVTRPRALASPVKWCTGFPWASK